jgi:hypothetical protein
MRKVNTMALRIDVRPIYISFFFAATAKFIISMPLDPHDITVIPISMCDIFVYINITLTTVKIKSATIKNKQTMIRNANSGNLSTGITFSNGLMIG